MLFSINYIYSKIVVHKTNLGGEDVRIDSLYHTTVRVCTFKKRYVGSVGFQRMDNWKRAQIS